MVGQLEANGALKLFVLGGDRDRLLKAYPALGDMRGPCQGPQVPLAEAVTMQKTLKNLQIHAGMVHTQYHAQQGDGIHPTLLA